MNYERLKLLRKHIAKTRRFDYAVWCDVKNWKNEDFWSSGESACTLNKKGCGTVGCVAGHAVAMFGGPRQQLTSDIRGMAAKLLRLNDDDASFLFVTAAGHGMADIDTDEATKKDALKRLDVLIATEKAK